MPVLHSDQICTTSDASDWRNALDETGHYDFYHLPSFHRLAEIRGEGKAVMPVFRNGRYVMAFPMLIREIDLPERVRSSVALKDATSVLGFAGPVVSHTDLPEPVRQDFLSRLQGFLMENSIISVYSRLNALTCPRDLLRDHGKTVDIGVTLSVDLSIPEEQQFARYRKSHRYEIERLRKMGLTCTEVGSERLDDFLRIYYETMDRVAADQAFYFDRSYFDYLLGEMSDVMHLFVCWDDGEAVAVGLFSACAGIVQYYLSGTCSTHLKAAPIKLLLESVRQWANRSNATVFHLGGGVGGQKDSLYQFKLGFGAQEHPYSAWQYISDHEAYDKLCRQVRALAGAGTDTSYFPEYRNPRLLERIRQ